MRLCVFLLAMGSLPLSVADTWDNLPLTSAQQLQQHFTQQPYLLEYCDCCEQVPRWIEVKASFITDSDWNEQYSLQLEGETLMQLSLNQQTDDETINGQWLQQEHNSTLSMNYNWAYDADSGKIKPLYSLFEYNEYPDLKHDQGSCHPHLTLANISPMPSASLSEAQQQFQQGVSGHQVSHIKQQEEKTDWQQAKQQLHPSLQELISPKLIWQTAKFRVRVDQTEQGLRYASWKKDAKVNSPADLVLDNGKLIVDGTGGNHRYEFSNGAYRYVLNVLLISDGRADSLQVFKGDTLLLNQDKQIDLMQPSGAPSIQQAANSSALTLASRAFVNSRA